MGASRHVVLGAAALLVWGCSGDDAAFLPGPATGSGGSAGSTSSQTGTGAGGGTSSNGGGGNGQGGAGGGGGANTGGGGGFDPLQDPVAQINHPGDMECRVVNVSLPISGVASDPQDGALSGASMVWTCSFEGQIGTGESFMHAPTPVGMHVITLTATDSDGNSGTDQVTLDVSQTCN